MSIIFLSDALVTAQYKRKLFITKQSKVKEQIFLDQKKIVI